MRAFWQLAGLKYRAIPIEFAGPIPYTSRRVTQSLQPLSAAPTRGREHIYQQQFFNFLLTFMRNLITWLHPAK